MFRTEQAFRWCLECWRIDAFKLWCWRRLLRAPWTARRSNQSILEEINPKYSLEGLTLKLQYFGYLMQKADSLEKTLMLGNIEGRRRSGRQVEMVGWLLWLNGHEFEQTLGDSEGQGGLACCSPRGRKNGHNWATEQQQQSSFLSLVTMCCILFFLIFIYFNWRLITLQYCIGLPYINMNPPQVYSCSPSWTPLPPHNLFLKIFFVAFK